MTARRCTRPRRRPDQSHSETRLTPDARRWGTEASRVRFPEAHHGGRRNVATDPHGRPAHCGQVATETSSVKAGRGSSFAETMLRPEPALFVRALACTNCPRGGTGRRSRLGTCGAMTVDRGSPCRFDPGRGHLAKASRPETCDLTPFSESMYPVPYTRKPLWSRWTSTFVRSALIVHR